MSPLTRLESDLRAVFAEVPAPVDPSAPHFAPLTIAERKAAKLGKAQHQAAHAITPTNYSLPVRQSDEE